VLIQEKDPAEGSVDLTLTLTKPQLLGLLAGRGLDRVTSDGDVEALKRLVGHLDQPDPNFAIVTP
jgi:alkyl sulfatase BDS1-like metallo-beta-lactamase superfamily hydrolase